jgi:hypothetical protein
MIPAVLVVLLVSAWTEVGQRGPLTGDEQEAFLFSNRKLIEHDAGAPPGTSLRFRSDHSNTDRDEVSVISVTSIFDLTVSLTPHTVVAWSLPHHGPGTLAEFDAAFDTNYASFWGALDEVGRRLERLGFHLDAAVDGPSPQARTVHYLRKGVTVSLGVEFPYGRVRVDRKA